MSFENSSSDIDRTPLDTVLQDVDGDAWDALVQKTRFYSFRQAQAYSEFLAHRHTAKVDYVRSDIAFACVRIKKLPLPGFGVAFVSSAPMLCSLTRYKEALGQFLDQLIKKYVTESALVLRIAAPIVPEDLKEEFTQLFFSRGFTYSPYSPAYRTIVVDTSNTPEVMRATLKQKWRNLLNNASKNSLEFSLDNSPNALDRFRPLFAELKQRKDFHVELDDEFFDRVQRSASENSRLYVGIVSKDGKDTAGAVVDLSGEMATYVLGATNEIGMKLKSAYLLHWNIMLEAQKRGCRAYDLGGIDPEGNPGVFHFKEGFGGVEAIAPGPFELRPNGIARISSILVDKLYRLKKQLRKTLKSKAVS